MSKIYFCFKKISDSRQSGKIKHKQYAIFFIIILAMLSGCNKFKEYYYFAVHHKKILTKMVELPNGIPSHDTMERTMHRVKSEDVNNLVLSFVQSIIGKDVIHLSIDGKFVRATREGLNKLDATDIVSAFLPNSKLSVLSQQTKTKESNKNEIPVMKDLLTSLKEKFPNAKFMITIDAIAAVKSILSLIVSFGWDYAICIKRKGKTNGGFSTEIAEEFALDDKQTPLTILTNDNGRDEIRNYYVIQDVSNLPSIDNWQTVKSIGKLETKMKNKKNNMESNQVRYFIFSKQLSCKDFALCQRKHWGIESFHYVLDNSFMEDRMRMKKGSSTLNLNLLRKFVYNVISFCSHNDCYHSYTAFRDTHRLASHQELLYIITHAF